MLDLDIDGLKVYPDWEATMKVVLTDLHITDVYMSFLLRLNQDFDDDLLLDVLDLLVD